MDKAQAHFYPPSSSPMLSTSKTNRLRRSLRNQSQQPHPPAESSRTQSQQPHPPAESSRTQSQQPHPPAESSSYCETAHHRNKNGRSPPPPEFKTPTRLPRCKYATGFCVESPNNDGEFQQDIVWDASSPSPVRTGKRGKSRPAGAAIGISEIVRRIAPMHGRPEVVEPTLQEWIGDSAAIPCTPEVQHPKAKKKSPRPNGVDDLLKLAKQFDFNMFQQDEEQAEDMHQQTLELLSEDILEYENGVQEAPWRPLVKPSPPATETATEDTSPATEDTSPARVMQDQNMEDDLELLFDKSTQHISGNLSQHGFLGSMETSSFTFSTAHGPTRSPIRAKHGPAGTRSDDDWENDNFLNDSLVIELTQHPQSFAPPQHCSTQRGPDGTLHDRKYPSRAAPGTLGGCGGMAKNEQRMPKKFPLTTVVTGAVANQAAVSNVGTHTAFSTSQSEALSRTNHRVSGSQLKKHSQPSGGAVSNSPAVPQPRTSLANASAKRNSAVTAPITSNTMKENQPTRSSNISATVNIHPSAAHKEPQSLAVPLASEDFPDEDLDQFFSSEPVWDDEGDDDLLCKMCEDLESRVEVVERPAAPKRRLSLCKMPGQGPAPSAASTKVGDNRKGHLDVNVLKHAPPSTPHTPPASQAAGRLRSLPEHVKPAPLGAQPARPSANSLAGKALSNIRVTRMESYRYGPPEQNSYGVSNVANSQGYGGGPSLKPTAGDKGQFTFKKPPSPSIKVINTGPEKCSMAEIELKKRQALERRRQRLRAQT